MVRGLYVFRLFQVIDPGKKIVVPSEVKNDLSLFLRKMLDEPDNLKSLDNYDEQG